MLQAMNTGHEGSMATIHANNPREAISRLEQMIGMAGLPMTIAVDPRPDRRRDPADRAAARACPTASAGSRRIAEITGMEGDIVQMQEIFKFVRTGTGRGRHRRGPLPGDRRAAALPRRPARQGHQDSRQLFRSEQAAVTGACRSTSIRSTSSMLLAGARRGAVRRGGLSAVLHSARRIARTSTAACSCWRTSRDRESDAGAAAPRARPDQRRRLPAAADRAQPAGRCSPGLTIGIGKLVAVRRASARWSSFARRHGLRAADCSQALGVALFCGIAAAAAGAAVPARPAAEEVRRAVPRCARHHRAQPARRPSGADRDRHGGARDARSDRHRVRHRRRRDHLRRRSRNRACATSISASARTTCRCS